MTFPKWAAGLTRKEQIMMKTAKMNRDTPACAHVELLVSPDTEIILPDILIEYLWKLALSEDWKNSEQQMFVLETMKLGRGMIQSICHTCNHDNLLDTRRVYGIEPVTCRLQVTNSPKGYQMRLCA